MFRNFILVGLGGAVGAMLRYGVTLLFAAFQWSGNIGTFLTNVAGSFVMGFLVAFCSQSPWTLMLATGLCGGFTTFSTFSVQAVTLLQQGRYAAASAYITGTVLCCILFAGLGYLTARRFR